MASEWLNRLFFSLIVIGLLMAVFGVYRYVDATVRLADNPAAQLRASGGELNIQSTAEGRGMIAADMERRDLEDQRAEAMTVGGIGLAVIAIGWLAMDFQRSRRKPGTPPPPTDTA